MITVGVTVGDPGGIGPEVVFRALIQLQGVDALSDVAFVVMGSSAVFDDSYYRDFLSTLSIIQVKEGEAIMRPGVYWMPCVSSLDVVKGGAHQDNGRLSYLYLEQAMACIQRGILSSLVTGPISKTSFHYAGVPYSGHTPYFADKTGVSDVSMAFYSPALKVVLATVHQSLHSVSASLTFDRLSLTARNAFRFAADLGIQFPKIAVAGLNPHAGEGGMFGDEEASVLIPFLQQFSFDGQRLQGPFSPDTVFFQATEGAYDVVIALYHDQGLIPVKLLGFHEAVNVTVGLPFVRTSPDHGTAYDRAFCRAANPSSMVAALRLAVRLSRGRVR